MPFILIDSNTGAPYVPLPAPFAEYRLSLLSPNDADSIHQILRQPSVASMLSRVPEPYTLNDAHFFLTTIMAPVFERVKDVDWTDAEQVKKVCKGVMPFIAIRDSRGTMVGDIGLRRNIYEWMELDNPEKMRKLCKENAEKEEGDPEIRYSVGFYLSPALQSKGLMTAAVTVFIDLARQYMKLRYLQGDCRADNPASRRVLEKIGLKYTTQSRMMYKQNECKVVILDGVFDSWQPES